jgi:LacI family transcriptional regulator
MPPDPAPPTMRELAALLGLSASTVSLALRNDPRIAASTRRRVQETARQTGYRLNPALTEMMGHVRRAEKAAYRETLGWLDMGESPHRFGPKGLDYLRSMWAGARSRAEQLGYVLEPFWAAEPGITASRLTAILRSRGIRGILIPPLPRNADLADFPADRFASVALSLTLRKPVVHRVVPAHFSNMQEILRRIEERGYRRPGLLLPEHFDERAGHRFQAMFLFHQSWLRKRDQVPIHICPQLTLDEGCRRWLDRHKPDAVVTLGALRHLETLTLHPPAVVLIGYASTDAGFAAIDENGREIGASGTDQLVGMLIRNEQGIPACPQTLLVPGVWVEGKSLPDLTSRPSAPHPKMAED